MRPVVQKLSGDRAVGGQAPCVPRSYTIRIFARTWRTSEVSMASSYPFPWSEADQRVCR